MAALTVAVNMLVSFAFFGNKNLESLRMACGRLLVDSGAFTAYSKGRVVRVQEYAEFLDKWRGVYDYAVTLDVIGDPAATARNTKWLHDRGHQVLPVFTRGGTPKDFDAMVREFGYVCVGGGVGMSQRHVVARLAALQRRAEEMGGGIHALGVGNMAALRAIRPYSADASNVSGGFLYGSIVCFDGRNLRSVALSDRRKIRNNALHFRHAGLSLAQLVASGRLPEGKGAVEGRDKIMRAGSLAFSCADETLGGRIPVPTGVTDTPGTHLYGAVTTMDLARPVVELDHLLHNNTWQPPPLWSQYGQGHAHQCRKKVPA